MDPPELPECPVCLQPFDGEITIPRVLACGHSVCETCLVELPKPLPRTLRCPACTQLVNYPHPQGPSALPKNIDLLRVSSLLSANPNHDHNNSSNSLPKPTKPSSHQLPQRSGLWAPEFYSNWKDWVVPEDALLIESSVDEDGWSCLYGRIVSSVSHARCLMKVNQKVSLVRVNDVGSDSHGNDSGKFEFSYGAKVLQILGGMSDGVRDELGLVLRASLNDSRVCKACGVWYDQGNKEVYLVCERHNLGFLNDLKYLTGEEETNPGIRDDISSFTMVGMAICESVCGLQKSGLITGCLALSCFDVDDFGRTLIDSNEVLVLGRRMRRIITKAMSRTQYIDKKELEMDLKEEFLEAGAFVSPELLFELLQREGVDLGCGSSIYAVGYASDIWVLACILLWLLIGKSFAEETNKFQCGLILSAIHGKGSDFNRLYMGWLEKVSTLIDSSLAPEFVALKEFLCKCLEFDPKGRPLVTDLWRRIRELIIKLKFNVVSCLEQKITDDQSRSHCLLLGELCQLLNGTNRAPERLMTDGLTEQGDNDRSYFNKVEEWIIERDLIKGLSKGPLKCIDLKGHLDCISGLAIGGGFLFSASFDKTINVWSLQDFTHVHSLKGHESKVMAIAFADEAEPLCISCDSGGGICIWAIRIPFDEEPIKRVNEEKDWRYSGIHALVVSRTGYFYTGSGDRSIKAWSMQDYTLSCTMTGHKSVVSTLSIGNGVLYSGSWDGTIRLWSLNDHSPLAVLGEDTPPGSLTLGSVLALVADSHTLVSGHENGSIKIWYSDVLSHSISVHTGAIFTVSMEGKWLFSGGWNKSVIVQEVTRGESHVEVVQIGSIPGDSVITALLYWQGKLFVGQADKIIKVYHSGV